MAKETRPSRRGSDARDDLRWLLEFARLDLDAVRPGVLLDLRLEAQRFAVKIPDGTALVFRGRIEPDDECLRRREPLERLKIEAFPARALLTAHNRLRDGLRLLRAFKEWTLPGPSRVVVRLHRRLGVSKTYHTSIDKQFLARAVDVIVAGWPDVRSCTREGCDNLFVPVRRQIHCSVECMRRAKWERYKQKHPKRVRHYHAEYVKRMKRQLGPRVKILKRSQTKKGR